MINRIEVEQVFNRLLTWMEKEEFFGWDPFDALNSPALKEIARLNRWAGVIALQLVKRCPINLRHLLCIRKERNAKGMGLVLTASVRLFRKFNNPEDLERAVWIAEWLDQNKSSGYSGACWGYPFDWANSGFYAPRGTPTIVNTAFIGHALLDLFEVTDDETWLIIAKSACDFVMNDLNRSPGKRGFCFSYTPLDHAKVYNANFLGASLLARVGKMLNNTKIMETVWESIEYSLDAQYADGSWLYGEESRSAWIDSFHTSYNLIALKYILEATGNKRVGEAINRGYDFYLRRFFLPCGTVKYYHNKTDPQDAHVYANAILFLVAMKDHPETPKTLVDKVIEHMIKEFRSSKGYFYWQKKYGITYRLPCMRWVQSWTLLALVSYLTLDSEKTNIIVE
ncbi:MAG: hypothetical protein BA873_10400 [Desulfobulbaceae bacterium C00003063]|nr:MAG: hypothetical protein BA873_10400 [Desulfobulbaceae bacterium C00003063]